MEETLKKKGSDVTEAAGRSVTLCIGSSLIILNGIWSWNMESTAVYGSDVMDFPQDFEGTKGIIHPDDLQKVVGALQVLADGEISALDFRLITTYGEVKVLSAKRVATEEPIAKPAVEIVWEETLQQFASRKETEFLKQRTELADAAEKLHRIGSWAVNKSTGEAWYSDGVYRLHRLPPQSLNAHPNTFNIFLHPEDRTTVIDTLESAYAQEIPVHLEYRLSLADGSVRTVRLVTHWMYNKKGQPLFSGVLRDLSEERELTDQTEAAVQTSRLHQQVLRYSEQSWNTGYFLVNLVTRKATYSENYYRIYGLKQQQLPGYNAFLNLVHPDDRTRVHDLIDGMYKEHQLPEAEFRIIRPDGKQRQLKQSGKVFASGSDLLMIGAVQDITVQRGLEKKIAELNERTGLHSLIQSITENLTDTSFITWYPEGHIQWSEGLYRMLGYKPDTVEPLPRLLHRQIHPDDLKAFKDTETLVTNGQPHDGLRFRIINKGGVWQLSISFHRIPSGNREIVIGVVQNFTKELALHQKLADTTGFAETLNAAISDIVLLTDSENMVMSWNRAATDKTGIKAEEALYSNLFDLFPALNNEAYLKQLQAVRLGSEVRELKARNLYLGRPHHYRLVPLLNESGETTRVLHVVQDISRELELQQQLSERLNFIESLVEASVDRIVVLDKHMNYVYWNKRAEDYYAISKNRVIGHNILEVFPGLRNDPSYNEFRRVLRGETVYLPAKLRDDSDDYFETYLIPVKDESGNVAAILWIVHNLSKEFALQQEQRKAKRQLEEEHRRLKEAQAIGRVGSFEWDAASDTIYWSDEMYRIHGLEPQSEEISLEKVVSFVHPDDVKNSVERIMLCRDNACSLSITHRIRRADGELRTIIRRLQSFADAEGKVTHLSGTVADITEQKEAEEKLREKTHYLQRIQETVPDMMSIMELPSRNLHYLNKDVFVAHGFDPEVMLKKSREERIAMIHPDDLQVLAGYYQKLNEADDDEIVTAEYRSTDLQGKEKWFLVRGKVFQRDQSDRVTHILNAIENITRRKNTEQEIMRLKDEGAQKVTDKYLVLFNAIDEGVYQCEVLFDKANKPVDIFYAEENPAAVRMIGQSMIGKTLKEVNPAYEPYWFEIWGDVALTGESRRMVQYSEPDKKWFDFYITKVGDKDSRQVVVVFQDITERRKAEEALQESESRFRSLVTATSDTVYKMSADWKVMYHLEGKNFLANTTEGDSEWMEKYIPADQRPVVTAAIEEAIAGKKVFEIEHQVYDATGNIAWTYSRAVPKLNEQGAIVEWIGAATDITGRKKAEKDLLENEEKLRRFNASLEQQVAERTGDLQQSTNELKKNFTILQQAEELAQMGSWEYEINTGQFNWSEGMYRLFGLPQGSRVQPEVYLDFAAEEDRSVAKRIIKNLKKAHQPFEETMQIKRNHDLRLLKIKASVVNDEQGKPQRIVGVDLDTTDIKQAEEKVKETQHWLEQTALASPDAIIVYDLQKKTPVFLNNCLAEWTGTTSSDLVNMGIDGRLAIIHHEDRLKVLHFNEMMKAAKEEEVLTVEYRIRTKEDSLLWIRNRSKVFGRDGRGKVTHILSILQDATEEKAAEQVLKDLNASLENKNQELESKNEEITSFAFVASHDLREPLRKIQTFSDWLLTRETDISETGKDHLQRMHSAVKRLDQLIDDILALTKMQVDKERMKRVDLNALLQSLKEELNGNLKKTGAVIESKPLPTITGAENQLLYLFKNIISNSIKFQPKGQRPRISIRAEREKQHIKIFVADNGIGIAEEHHKKIFEMFRRLHGRAEYEGTGMGLAICKKIMEKHGGKITVESEEGTGATFVCWFPASLLTN